MVLNKILDVAFNDNVTKVVKLSCRKTLDIQFGIYMDGKLTINFKPTNGWKDWLINLLCWNHKGYHYGYYKEWKRCSEYVFHILAEDWAMDAAKQGIIISGRSKGAAEAMIASEDILRQLPFTPCVYIGGVGSPKVVTETVMDRFRFLRHNMLFVCFRNDIVPSFFPWFKAGPTKVFGERTHGRSIKDHTISTTDRSVFEEDK